MQLDRLLSLIPCRAGFRAVAPDPTPDDAPAAALDDASAVWRDAAVDSLGDRTPTDITDDSRTATPGSLFVARRGVHADGSRFARHALERGAEVVLSELAPADLGLDPPRAGAVWLQAADPVTTGRVAQLADHFFEQPTASLDVIGVTGTNGKTTTTWIARALLQAAGLHVGLIGTVVVDDGRSETPATLTTPSAIELTRVLAAMRDHGCRVAAVEASSHGLVQGRLDATRFRVGVFTNLSGDHLDFHRTMDAYADAKARLFEMLPDDGKAVVYAQDPWAERMLRDCRARVVRCGVVDQRSGPTGAGEVADEQGPDAFDWCALLLDADRAGCRIRLRGPEGEVETRLPLIGRHNVANALLAVAACHAVAPSVGLRGWAEALRRCPATPGRLEAVVRDGTQRTPPGERREPLVLVDYAHTDDALENVLRVLRPLSPARLICVFGCGGDRDVTKRPRMAAVAARYADRVIITSDNPRTESPMAIIDHILAGVPSAVLRGAVDVEPDRAAAIDLAVMHAGPGDVVLIAGKGHETYQIVGDRRLAFDDREAARDALARRGARAAGTGEDGP